MGIHLQTTISTTIDLAIRSQLVIQIKLNGQWRTVEPYQLGLHKDTQAPIVYGYCRDVIPCNLISSRWQVFNLDEVESIEMTYYSFQPHIGYEGRYDFMQTVYRRVKPLWEEVPAGYLPVRVMSTTTERMRLSRRLSNRKGGK